jgi:DNA-binding NtrC family response regulator
MVKTVILIDDDQDDLEILAARIISADSTMHCISFRYPVEAVRVMSEDLVVIPDFVFIDINMPELRGNDVVKISRENKDFDQTIIVVLSTAMPLRTQQAMKALGANFAFEKPIHLQRYDVIINEVLFASTASF